MTDRMVWLEAALSGPWGRELQPKIPISVREIVDEGIACAKEGAAVVHVHAYDEATGRQRDARGEEDAATGRSVSICQGGS
jgi:3-keto-5-aminohexanoate cleavage enzyme